LSVLIAGAHVASIMYRTITLSIRKSDTFFTLRLNAFYHVSLYVFILVMTAKNGQGVSNDVLKLRRQLAQVLIKISVDPKAAGQRQLRDFHRLVSVQPLSIELPAMPVGMYFLPTVLNLTANYVIVN
ncbi:hypothetical protein ABMA28_014490, partial [Loxostege sticticalis]